MPEIAYVNGVWGPVAEAKVSIEDRGFQFGDGIYEVIVAYDGRPFLLDRHIERFRHSAEGIQLHYDFAARPVEPIIREGLRRCGFPDVMIYIQITRGAAPRSHLPPVGMTPTVVMTFKPLPRLPESLRERGAKVMTVPETRWANCYIKAITLLPNTLAKTEAAEGGYDDAIFVTAEGEVRECTSSNVFIIHDGHLMFPPRNESVLHGITQSFIMECAEAVDMPIREQQVMLKDLRGADEVFLSSTLQEVLGITLIDGKPVGDGRVGPWTKKLYAEFVARSRNARGAVAVAAPR